MLVSATRAFSRKATPSVDRMLMQDAAVCIHEEDAGILFKHSDFRDDSVIVTRARKLIIQQIFTAANYEYAIQVSRH